MGVLSGDTQTAEAQEPEARAPGQVQGHRSTQGLLPARAAPRAGIFTCLSVTNSQAARSQSHYVPVSLINKSMRTLTVLKIQFKLFVCCCLL